MVIAVFVVLLLTAVGLAAFTAYLAYRVATTKEGPVEVLGQKKVTLPTAVAVISICFAAVVLLFILAIQVATNQTADVRSLVGLNGHRLLNPFTATLSANEGQPSTGWVYMGPRRHPEDWVMDLLETPVNPDGEHLVGATMQLKGPAILRTDHFNDFQGTLLWWGREPDVVRTLDAGDCVRIESEEPVGFYALWVEVEVTACPLATRPQSQGLGEHVR